MMILVTTMMMFMSVLATMMIMVPDLGVDDDDFLVTVPVPGNHDIILCLL